MKKYVKVCSRMQMYSYCIQKVDKIFLNCRKYTKFGKFLLKDEEVNIKIQNITKVRSLSILNIS